MRADRGLELSGAAAREVAGATRETVIAEVE
jgi:hypothetical protein